MLIMCLAITACSESPLDKCIAVKMGVWDQKHPSGIEEIGCGFDALDPTKKCETTLKSRIEQLESETLYCISATK